jgi:hypothetical protein
MHLILLALGIIAPTPKPASSEDAFHFLKDILRGPSEATVFAPGQNQDLMDALGAILLEPSTAKASQPGAAVSTSKKNLMATLDEGDLSDFSLNVKQLKATVPAGNVTTSSSMFSFLLPIHPAFI